MFEPKFTITNKILKNIGQIEAAKEVIENADGYLKMRPLSHYMRRTSKARRF